MLKAYTLDAKSPASSARLSMGTKAYHLYLLTHAGFRVPEWVVIPASEFRGYLKDSGLEAQIIKIFKDHAEAKDYGSISRLIEAAMLEAPLSGRLLALVQELLAKFSGQSLAIRSSGLDEDGPKHSFAGLFSSVLNVRGEEDFLRALKTCWSSAYSERSIAYRALNGLAMHTEMAVLVQVMIPSEHSGVIFSVDPTDAKSESMLINAVPCLGEALVSGETDSFQYRVSRQDGRLVYEHLAQDYKPEQGLSPAQRQRLWQAGMDLENFFGCPQDIECAFYDSELWILQSRAITTLKTESLGRLQIWDNSNIVESFGGLTAPLTFSFARYVYREAYIQLCGILLVSKSQLGYLEYYLGHMLGIFKGAIYYNLMNWYRLLTIVPGFKQNRDFMETMMGVKSKLADEVAQACVAPPEQRRWDEKLRKAASGLRLFYFHLRADTLARNFLAYFYKVYKPFHAKRFEGLSADQLYQLYRELEQKLLKHWQPPLINDMLCMIHFGALKKLSQKYFGAEGLSLVNDLLCGDGHLESAEPTKVLMALAADAAQIPELKNFLLTTPPRQCHEALQPLGFSDFFAKVELYIERFGFRCMNEMKLEQADLHDDPSFVYLVLQNYLKSAKYDLKAYAAREQDIRQGAESRAQTLLKGYRKLGFFWLLGHARRSLRNRENMRFCRTRVYGLVRRIFFAWGRDFARRGLIDKAEDIFYLEIGEVFGAMDGTLTLGTLRSLSRQRQAAYRDYAKEDLPPRFMTRGPTYAPGALCVIEEEATLELLPDLGEDQLQGLGCCPGVVEGIIKCVESPSDDMQLNGEILVAPRTDPGWVPLYPSCSGLIVERGSLLSHSAIVAREMGLPAIVGVQGVKAKLQSGMRVRMDGSSGLIEILAH